MELSDRTDDDERLRCGEAQGRALRGLLADSGKGP